MAEDRHLQEARRHANQLLAEKQAGENLEFFEDAVARFPDDPELRLVYGTSLLVTQPEEAARQVARAASLAPDDPVLLTRGAGILLSAGYTEEAQSYVGHALDLTPDGFVLEADLINLSGCILALHGEAALAEEALREAIALEPSNGPFVRDLARFLVQRGRLNEALEEVDRALGAASDDDDLRDFRRELSQG